MIGRVPCLSARPRRGGERVASFVGLNRVQRGRLIASRRPMFHAKRAYLRPRVAWLLFAPPLTWLASLPLEQVRSDVSRAFELRLSVSAGKRNEVMPRVTGIPFVALNANP